MLQGATLITEHFALKSGLLFSTVHPLPSHPHTVAMWHSITRTCAFIAVTLTLFSTSCSALEVSPDSPCASKCIDRNDGNPSWRNQSLTFNDMLPCYNWEYMDTNSTAAALKFRACQECQMTSGWRTTFEDEGTQYTEQDTTWFLCKSREYSVLNL